MRMTTPKGIWSINIESDWWLDAGGLPMSRDGAFGTWAMRQAFGDLRAVPKMAALQYAVALERIMK